MSGSGSLLTIASSVLSEQSILGKLLWMVLGGFVTKVIELMWGMHQRSKDRAVEQAVSIVKYEHLEKRVDQHDKKIDELLSTKIAKADIEDSTAQESTKTIKEKSKAAIKKSIGRQKNPRS